MRLFRACHPEEPRFLGRRRLAAVRWDCTDWTYALPLDPSFPRKRESTSLKGAGASARRPGLLYRLLDARSFLMHN
jgi:hypothetical protein